MDNWRIIPGAFLIVLGVGFLLGIDVWHYFWPAVLIFVGIKMLVRQDRRFEGGEFIGEEEVNENIIDMEVIFNGVNRKVISDNFEGGKVVSVFGGGELDLTEAKIVGDKAVTLEVENVFGGMKIVVPKEWNVSTSVVGMIGAFGNQTKLPKKGEEKGRLHIKGAAVFGGGEVVNG